MNSFVACLDAQTHSWGENGRFSYTYQPNNVNHVRHWGLAPVESDRLAFVGRGVIWNWFNDYPTHADCFWHRFCQGYEQGGVDFLCQLEGQFGFALFDKQTETLYAFRDPLGYYPLYLLREAGHTAVSSHLKPLCQIKQERQISPEAALLYMQMGYLVGGTTLIQGIERLLPGEYVKIAADDTLSRHRYWKYPSFVPEAKSAAAFVEEARAQMNDAVDRNLDGHEHVALFLSGGVDSTVLAGMLAQRPHIQTTAYNFGLNIAHPTGHKRVDYLRDAPFARLVAEQHRLDYRECRLDRSFSIVDALQTVLPQLDSPLMSPNAFTKSYMLAEAAREGITAVMTGSAAFMPFETLLEEDMPYTGKETLVELALDDSARTRKFDIVRQLFPDFQQITKQDTLTLVAPYFDLSPTRNDLEAFELAVCSLYLTEKTVYVHHLVGDQVGMAAKMPFYDSKLAQFRARIPRSLRGADDYPSKYLLLKAFEDLIPPTILTRSKAGFPSYYWNRGELEQLQNHLFSDDVLRALPFLSPSILRRLVTKEKSSTRKSAGKLTWGIMILVMWYLHFVLEWNITDITSP